VEYLTWIYERMGIGGVVAVACALAVGWMLKEFVAVLKTAMTGHNSALDQIVQTLGRQEQDHKATIAAQAQHTEILRSLVIEVKVLGDSMYRGERDRTEDWRDLVVQILQAKPRNPEGGAQG